MCISNPCQNGGVCSNGINEYTCDCAQGYNGTSCENGNNITIQHHWKFSLNICLTGILT